MRRGHGPTPQKRKAPDDAGAPRFCLSSELEIRYQQRLDLLRERGHIANASEISADCDLTSRDPSPNEHAQVLPGRLAAKVQTDQRARAMPRVLHQPTRASDRAADRAAATPAPTSPASCD
jgi:hypothetical protein